MHAFPDAPSPARTMELVDRLHADDPTAWDELYRMYHDELLFTIRARLGVKLRAVLQSEDVLQSVALEAFRALPQFEHRGTGSLRAFLHTLVLNKIRDRADTWAAKKRSGTVPLTDALQAQLQDTSAAPNYFDGDRFEGLEACLRRLPEEMREVIVLRKIEGLSSKEAAERIGKSDAATRQLFSRAMAKLTVMLTPPQDDGTATP